jgi:hypothetical protein
MHSCSKNMDMQKTVFVDNFVIYTNINKMKYLKEQASTFVYGICCVVFKG